MRRDGKPSMSLAISSGPIGGTVLHIGDTQIRICLLQAGQHLLCLSFRHGECVASHMAVKLVGWSMRARNARRDFEPLFAIARLLRVVRTDREPHDTLLPTDKRQG